MLRSVPLFELSLDLGEELAHDGQETLTEYQVPKTKFKKGNADKLMVNLWHGYTKPKSKSIEGWFGYYPVKAPGLFIARVPTGTWGGGVKETSLWALFHLDSGHPLTTLKFQTRRAAWACASRVTDYDWTKTMEEIRADKETVTEMLDKLTGCYTYGHT